jgi:hypothetical protein
MAVEGRSSIARSNRSVESLTSNRRTALPIGGMVRIRDSAGHRIVRFGPVRVTAMTAQPLVSHA